MYQIRTRKQSEKLVSKLNNLAVLQYSSEGQIFLSRVGTDQKVKLKKVNIGLKHNFK